MASSILSAKRLREILDYNPETGIFTWKVMLAHRRKPGDVAGSLTHGYIEIGIENHSYRAHHLAWLYIHGELPQGMIDHIDGNRVNNAIANLRIATNQQNSQNKLLTFCVLVLRNGFTVTGESACASPDNFDAEVGQKIARQNAVAKIVPVKPGREAPSA